MREAGEQPHHGCAGCDVVIGGGTFSLASLSMGEIKVEDLRRRAAWSLALSLVAAGRSEPAWSTAGWMWGTSRPIG
jgi:hypothetical protein